MKKINFTGSEWKKQLYEYTVDLVRSADKFHGVSEYDLEDIIQDIYLYMLEYSIRRIESLGSVSFNRDMGNWSNCIRVAIDAYDASNLYCKKVYCSGYSYIDDSILMNKDTIRSLEERARFRSEKCIYCAREYYYNDRIYEDLAKELGISISRVGQLIRYNETMLRRAAHKMYSVGEWGEMCE